MKTIAANGHRWCKYFTTMVFFLHLLPGEKLWFILTGRKSFLTVNQQRQSIEGNAKHHHHHNQVSRCQKRTFGLCGARED